jgi:hypothetical protein
MLFKLNQSAMPRIWFHAKASDAPFVVPLSDQRRIPLKRLGRGQFLGIELRPQPFHGIAERGHAALGGDASPGQYDNPAGIAQGGRRGLNV